MLLNRSGGRWLVCFQRYQECSLINCIALCNVDFHNSPGVGTGNIQRDFAGFQGQDIVIAFDAIARLDQKFKNKDIAAGA